MIRVIRIPIVLGAIVALAGCAGGWRDGAPPGAAPAVSTAATAGPASSAPAAGGVTFVYRGEASTVAVAGEFNGWNTSADPMEKQSDGSWKLVKKLSPGRHPYKFVIDGGTWMADPAATESVDDGFGGKNSIVVVGPGAVAPAAPAKPAATPAVAGTTPTAGGVRFVYRGDAGSVALAGEFNGWNTSADPMAKQPDGSWLLVKTLEPGRYAYKFVIDGGTWKEDAAASEFVDDGFGGKNSVVVVGAGGAPVPSATPPPAAASAPASTVPGKPPVQTPDGVRFTCGDGAATSVHLAGEFNGWSTTSDPLTKQSDGSWTIVRRLEPGRWQYKFVVNGTTWKSDDANPLSTDDGFGGKNSVVEVK
jgi:1,4-alpha-glucan branching enzyme